MEVDDALMKLGKFNRWRIATYCMVCCSVTVTGCWHMMVVVFVGTDATAAVIIIPAKAREYVFTSVGLCGCLCLSVTTITKKIVDGFAPNFMRRFLREKGRPSSCFVTIGRGMWK